MLREHVFDLLRNIDAVEADLRKLENRLSYIRVHIRRELLGDHTSDYVPEREQKVQR